MKVSLLLPLAVSAVLTTAFTFPDDHSHNQLVLDDEHHDHDGLQDPISHIVNDGHDGHNEAPGRPGGRGKCHRDPLRKGWVLRRPVPETTGTHIDLAATEAFNVLQWGRSSRDGRHEDLEAWFNQHYRPGFRHHRKRPDGKPIQRPPPPPPHDVAADNWEIPGEEDGPGKRPPHGPPKPPPHGPPKWHIPHPPNRTIWEIISASNHTTNFTSIIAEFPDLVAILNGTSLTSKYTLFVPTDKAFEKFKDVPKDKRPPKEFIKKFLTYHLSHDFYPTPRLFLGHTLPSALDTEELGGPQRLRVGPGPHGITVNFYSTILAANIFATNGVVHAVDNVLFPPPPAWRIISLLPTEFSTLILGFHVTNLTSELHGLPHVGGTLFAPSNQAFKALGPRVNAFLFSPWGRKYLKALLLYHVVVNETLYSDAYYHPTIEEGTLGVERATEIPKGKYHVDLPTLLKGKHLSIDISRFGAFISILINAASSVKVQDGIARDGVIQVVGKVLIPPKEPPKNDNDEPEKVVDDNIEGGSLLLSVEEFKKRFEGLVEEDTEEMKALGEYKEEDIIAMWD